MVEGILKYSPEDQRLYREDQLLDDAKTLGDSGFPNNVAKAQSPAEIGLAVKQEGERDGFLRWGPLLRKRLVIRRWRVRGVAHRRSFQTARTSRGDETAGEGR